MKLCKRIAPVLLAMMMLLSTTAFAAGSIDLARDVNLTISYQDGSTPLVDAAFNIYLVASVDETGELTTTDDFQQFHVDIRGRNDAAWKALASTLEGYVLRDNITPTDSGKTDASGYLRFPTGAKNRRRGCIWCWGAATPKVVFAMIRCRSWSCCRRKIPKRMCGATMCS